MTEQQYKTRRLTIEQKIYLHSRTNSSGKPVFPRCLAADYRELEKLDEEYANGMR